MIAEELGLDDGVTVLEQLGLIAQEDATQRRSLARCRPSARRWMAAPAPRPAQTLTDGVFATGAWANGRPRFLRLGDCRAVAAAPCRGRWSHGGIRHDGLTGCSPAWGCARVIMGACVISSMLTRFTGLDGPQSPTPAPSVQLPTLTPVRAGARRRLMLFIRKPEHITLEGSGAGLAAEAPLAFVWRPGGRRCRAARAAKHGGQRR
jgi:hypothetical protein